MGGPYPCSSRGFHSFVVERFEPYAFVALVMVSWWQVANDGGKGVVSTEASSNESFR